MVKCRLRMPITEYGHDDDGEKTMTWVENGGQRERISCKQVEEIFSKRPWVDGTIIQTIANSDEDVAGIDMYVPVGDEMLAMLGIWSVEGLGIPIQIKSSLKEAKSFLNKKKMTKEGRPIFRNGRYTITLNGTDSKMLILTDIVGQMIVLARQSGMVKSEEEFLDILENIFEDSEAAETWREQREVVLDSAWYGRLFDGS